MIDRATRPLVLDGGLGTLLEDRRNDVSSALWSARVLRDDPDEVCSAHLEVEALALELADLGVLAFVSLSADSAGYARPGALAATLRTAASIPGVIAVGVNCCAPTSVGPALAQAPAVPLVAYPNTGERWDATTRTWSRGVGVLAEAAPAWVAAGARLVGGCCRSTPADIAAIAAAVR